MPDTPYYKSITITLVLLTGIVLILLGAYLVVKGDSNTAFGTAFEFKLGEYTVKTQDTGLAMIVLGVILIGVTLRYLPPGVRPANLRP